MLNKINTAINTITNKYFIEVCFMKKDTPDAIPVGVDHQYIITDNDGNILDYTKDPAQATCFGFILGLLVTNGLRKASKKIAPDLFVSMVSVVDADFIHEVTGN